MLPLLLPLFYGSSLLQEVSSSTEDNTTNITDVKILFIIIPFFIMRLLLFLVYRLLSILHEPFRNHTLVGGHSHEIDAVSKIENVDMGCF